ncbi:MAG: arylsulfatase [Akkermansiaceae bacterium]|nr:arylsulfatase [Akkermansiaceae bacterium]
MKKRNLPPSILTYALAVFLPLSSFGGEQPNIVFILCDDLGYGDIQALNPEHGKIKTPSVDKLAAQGMVFKDAHSGSAVCTPTRYGLMTGRYSWRTTLQRGVVQGFKPNLIAEGRPTVAGFLKAQGYHTGIIGKWHLNFQYTDAATGAVLQRKGGKSLAPVGSKIPDGPIARGFDYFHGFHHAGDMKGVIENDTVIAHEEEVNMLPRITRKAVEYIETRASQKETPFFLYVPFGSPHMPIVPSPEWVGKSGLGLYGDFVMQTDDGVGQIMAALDKHGLAANTLVIFSSDNGCSKAADIPSLKKQGHRVSAGFRGSKADLWDGGHRVPFIVRWPEHVAAGSTSDQLICLTDFFATAADITGMALPANSAEDSVSFLPALSGKPIVSTRAGVIHHSISGHFAYRQGKWKLLLARGSAGWTGPKENQLPEDAPKAQLYDMEKDPGETKNLYETNPEVAARLLAQLEADVFSGRSTKGVQGEKSRNDIDEIRLWKNEKGNQKGKVKKGKRNGNK